MTLPTRSPVSPAPVAYPAVDDDVEATDEAPATRVARPIALMAVIVVGILILTACLFGAALSGVFGNLFARSAEGDGNKLEVTIAPDTADLATRFDDGLWLVGRDIVPGTYQATVPATSGGCTWERGASADGTLSSMLGSGAGDPGVLVVVTIKATDAVFRSHDCGSWVQIAPPDPTAT
ncbi:MAG: hypothetical protein ACM30G_10760 [Micromonosporaceae bacterium]